MNILVADDCEDAVFMAKRKLSRSGHVVDVASNGKEALELFAEHPQYYDVIVLDNNMPILAGLNVLEIMRGLGFNRPVVIYSDADASQEARARGGDFVMKDSHCEGLLSYVCDLAL